MKKKVTFNTLAVCLRLWDSMVTQLVLSQNGETWSRSEFSQEWPGYKIILRAYQ